MSDIDYDTLTQALQRVAIATDAAELHGSLTGLLCALGTQHTAWLEAIAPDLVTATASGDALATEVKQLLQSLYQQTAEQLLAGEFAFTPLLPDDEQLLADRATALGHWCQGFLIGLKQAGVTSNRGLSAELTEIYKDFGEISQITADEQESNEDDEEAYAELFEYLKVGAILFYEELQSPIVPPDNSAHLH